ncbi:MAG: rluD 1 [Firmicutes bacterium]|nr:rluD 1 [Bacillota bacterium]
MKSYEKYPVQAEYAGLTVEEYLKQILHYSGRKIQKLTRLKGIRLNNKPAFLQKKVKPTDTLQIMVLEDRSGGIVPEAGNVEILYEDESLLVLNKPAGQLVHPTGRTTSGTLANFLAWHLQKCGGKGTVHPLHRLDRDTSGCILFAKDAHSQFLLEQQLNSGIVKRTYQALVQGVVDPPVGTIDAPIGAHPTQANRRAVSPQGDPAITNYLTLRTFEHAALLELTLETGRTHQIRLHLAHINHPLIGDGMYGIRAPWMKRQALHAISLSFHHLKDDREIVVHAPLPEDFSEAITYCEEKN